VAASTRDRTEAGQLAAVARMAHAVASSSASLPLALLIDDADRLDPGLVERFLFTILDRCTPMCWRRWSASPALLDDDIRVMGPDHPQTLAMRSNVAFWTGKAGDTPRSRILFEALLPDRIRVLGLRHPDTLATRYNIASLIGDAGDAPKALALLQSLLLDRTRMLGSDHPDTLETQHEIERLRGA